MATFVRTCAVLAAACVALSFVMFANDELTDGSQRQATAIEGGAVSASRAELDRPGPRPAVERIRERRHSSVREYLDDADDVLVGPFTGIVDSDSVWLTRLALLAIGLALYGLGGLLLANALPRPQRDVRGWREA